MSKPKTLGKAITKKATREVSKIAKGVAKEGGRIVIGVVKGFLGAFSPFH